MFQAPMLTWQDGSYRSPTLSPGPSLPSISNSFLLDDLTPQPLGSPGSTTGFEPLDPSSVSPTINGTFALDGATSLPPRESPDRTVAEHRPFNNALQLITLTPHEDREAAEPEAEPKVKAEVEVEAQVQAESELEAEVEVEVEARVQARVNERGNGCAYRRPGGATVGARNAIPSKNNRAEPLVARDMMSGYGDALLELRTLRRSSIALLNAVLKLNHFGDFATLHDPDLDDVIVDRISDIEDTLRATTNTMSRLYGLKSTRFRPPFELRSTRDKCGQTSSDGSLSRAEGTQASAWDSSFSIVCPGAPAESLQGLTNEEQDHGDDDKDDDGDEDDEDDDPILFRTLCYQWKLLVTSELVEEDRFQQVLGMVILQVFVLILMGLCSKLYQASSIWVQASEYSVWDAR